MNDEKTVSFQTCVQTERRLSRMSIDTSNTKYIFDKYFQSEYMWENPTNLPKKCF